MKRKTDEVKRRRKSYSPKGSTCAELKAAVDKAHARLVAVQPYIDKVYGKRTRTT